VILTDREDLYNASSPRRSHGVWACPTDSLGERRSQFGPPPLVAVFADPTGGTTQPPINLATTHALSDGRANDVVTGEVLTSTHSNRR